MRHRMSGVYLALLAAANSLSPISLVSPVAVQQIVELTGEDRALSADYEEVCRVSSFDMDVRKACGEIAGTAFDANGNLYIFVRQASCITVVVN
tara:strand:+ start:211 stop:492 length:282 start_codon:yes stop_codon:yes gene_type:complete